MLLYNAKQFIWIDVGFFYIYILNWLFFLREMMIYIKCIENALSSTGSEMTL